MNTKKIREISENIILELTAKIVYNYEIIALNNKKLEDLSDEISWANNYEEQSQLRQNELLCL
tara:strand:+ start:52 stop:240 length:189 start_codon:yes stop_codon:yes gene_type:complete